MDDSRATYDGNPLLHLTCITQTEKRRQRRALTLAEQQKLLETAKAGDKKHNLTGYERYLVYTLALQTGFRANEIRNLTVSSFDFDNQNITIKAAYSKNKKTSTMRFFLFHQTWLVLCLSFFAPRDGYFYGQHKE